jgi:hypothetical protein
VARINPPSATRPLLNENLTPTEQSRRFFNLVSYLGVIEYAGTPENNVDGLLGQFCLDTSNADGYMKTSDPGGNTGWKKITP